MSRDELYLRHILDAIQKIERYAEAGRDEFMTESMRHDAVIRQMEIIGEAAKRLSPQVTGRSPHIPWKQVAGMRDVGLSGRASEESLPLRQINLPSARVGAPRRFAPLSC